MSKIILRGQIEYLINNFGLFVYEQNGRFEELIISQKYLEKINCNYEGAQIDIKIIKSKREPIEWKINYRNNKMTNKL